ncbi:hypothetical protein DFH06DRAFT_1130557 [Mycena polygramma]|nr:hypothetical protein DFH06DRAFT_1130557 [Mycena polygramma]
MSTYALKATPGRISLIPRIRSATLASVAVISLLWLVVLVHLSLVGVDGEDAAGTLSSGSPQSIVGLLSAGLTLFTLATMFVQAYRRPESWRSRIIAEACWLSVLWILWAVTAIMGVMPNTSGRPSAGSEEGPLLAFPFVVWVLLMAYTITILICKNRIAPVVVDLTPEAFQFDCRSVSDDATLIGHKGADK